MTFLWLVSRFSNHISCLVSSFEYRSCLKSTLHGSLTKFKSSIAHERSSLRSLVQTRWQKNKIITLYRQSNQGGLTKLSTILYLRFNNIHLMYMVAYRYHSGRVHNYVSSAPRKQRHLPGKRGSQIGLPPSPHAFHP